MMYRIYITILTAAILFSGCTESDTVRNQAPVAVDDHYEVVSGISSSLDVLSNDSDPDGVLDRGSIEIVTAPQHGRAEISQGTVYYVSEAEYSGEDSFVYRVKDEKGDVSNDATVSLSVIPLNLPPVAKSDSITVTAGEQKRIDVLHNDKDPDGALDIKSVVIWLLPQHGNATVDTQTGEVIYRAESEYEGVDQFSYRVRDMQGYLSNMAIVTVNIHKVERPQKAETGVQKWYIQLRAENLSTHQCYTGAKIGELAVTDEAKHHSLVSFGSFGSPYITIVCKDPDGLDDQSYTVYFRAYEDDSSEKKWQFEVQTSQTNAEIVLRWQGLYALSDYIDEEGRRCYHETYAVNNPLLKKMKLIDTVTGMEIPAVSGGVLQSYRFNMGNETSRVFEWVVQERDVVIRQPKISQHIPVPTKQKVLEGTKNGIFDIHQPPIIKDIDGK
jgi:hypothetical protein